jgi:hypothetical protein
LSLPSYSIFEGLAGVSSSRSLRKENLVKGKTLKLNFHFMCDEKKFGDIETKYFF